MMYEFDLKKVIEQIEKEKPKRVMIQLPDGLRQRAKNIQDEIVKKTGVEVLIWAGSCYGSCDIPMGIERVGVDMLVHFGHSPWRT